MTITVYTKPGCGQCEQTKKQLERKGLTYTAVDIFEDEAAYRLVEATGKTLLPYVTVHKNGKLVDSWHGFRYDEIRGLTKYS